MSGIDDYKCCKCEKLGHNWIEGNRYCDDHRPQGKNSIENKPTKSKGSVGPPKDKNQGDGFSWDVFDERTVNALAMAMGYSQPGSSRPYPPRTKEWWDQQTGKTKSPGLGKKPSILEARKFLGSRVPSPTPDFVRDYKKELLQSWLPNYAGTKHIVDCLIDAGVGPGDAGRPPDYLRYIEKTKNTKTLQAVICEAMWHYGAEGHAPDPGEKWFIPSLSILKPSDQPKDTREPHSYQEETWAKLYDALRNSQETKRFEGLIVMPTGSGKTYTAVHWLLESVVSKGSRVLWLAHRHELLNQARDEFIRLAGLVKPSDRELRIRVVSGMHCTASQIGPEDDIVVASVASLARNQYVTQALIDDPSLFLVIDEAHHAPAKSYRNIVRKLRQKGSYRILGITATPTRTIEKEQPILAELFGGKIIHPVETRDLIENDVLARPHIISVKTHAEVEKDITQEDRKYVRQFHDLSEIWHDRIAHFVERNAIIVQHYRNNIDRYGPTLIFAINVAHAALLTEELKEKGISAEYVASYRPDGTEGEVGEIIQRFHGGKLQVLVNVQMLTEGVDIPAIQTVFLTRPTASEILLRQMIGRGLRGPKMGGGPTAYLVSFEDHWQEFNDWESPFDLVPDIVKEAEEVEVVDTGKDVDEGGVLVGVEEPLEPPEPPVPVDWDVIKELAIIIRKRIRVGRPDFFEAVPCGWYVLEYDDPDLEGHSTIIPVYDHELPCWQALVERVTDDAGKSNCRSADEYFEDFFGDCDYPRPSNPHVSLMVDYLIKTGEPGYHDFKDRERCDPYKIADEIRFHNLRHEDKEKLIKERYAGLAEAIYPSLREYWLAIESALLGDPPSKPKAVPVFFELPKNPLRPGPAYDLATLMAEVLSKGQQILGKKEPLPHSGEVTWTKRLMKGWYAMANWEEDKETPFGHGRIRVNKLLDSPSVDVDTLRFLLWHEYLHLYLRSEGRIVHTKEFRRHERMWPGYVDANRFLDTLNEVFWVQYW